MSLEGKASLIFVPDSYKTGKVALYRPEDVGDLTFTRNSNATRVNADGLVEKVRQNVLLQSNQFNTTWATYDTSVTGGQADKDGGTDAWLLAITGATGFQTLRQIGTFSISGINTFSIYAKAGALNWMRINTGVSSTYFNISTGAVGTDSSLGASIEAVGNGYYRCTVPFTGSCTFVFIYPAIDNNNPNQTSGNIYIQNAQLEAGDIATDYIPTTSAAVSVGPTANVPRLDYSGGCPSLLFEPQRTNIAYPSETMTGYAKSSAITLTGGAAISPQGYQNATYYFCNTTTTNGYLLPSFNGTSGIQYAVSFYAKAKELTRIYIKNVNDSGSQSWFELSDGTYNHLSGIDSMSIESVGNGWYRCIAVSTSSSTGIKWIPIIKGNANEGVYIWGLQIEAGSYATSYIPTLGASVTKLADDMDTTFGTPFTTNGGATLFLEIDGTLPSGTNATGAHYATYFSSGDFISYNRNSGGNHRIRVNANSVGNFFASPVSSVNTVKLCASVTASTATVYANGVLVDTVSITGSWSSATSLVSTINDTIGSIPVKQMILFPTALTNAQLAELTAL